MLEFYQLALFPESVTLARTRPEQNERRFYHLEIRPDLFGRTMLVRRWGRIGTSGRQRLDPHPDAGAALNAWPNSSGPSGGAAIGGARREACRQEGGWQAHPAKEQERQPCRQA